MLVLCGSEWELRGGGRGGEEMTMMMLGSGGGSGGGPIGLFPLWH